jgi:hypothetical protein
MAVQRCTEGRRRRRLPQLRPGLVPVEAQRVHHRRYDAATSASARPHVCSRTWKRGSVEDYAPIFGGNGRTGPIASKNCAVVACQSSMQQSPPVPRRGSGACPDTRRSNKFCATTISTHSVSPDTEVRLTHRWREQGFEPSVPRDTTNPSMSPPVGSPLTEKSERKRTDTRSVGPFPRGTDGSNPFPPGKSLRTIGS